MSWLEELLDATSEAETPRSFIYWSGLAAISAVVKNNVWLPLKGDLYKVFPNIFVLLIGPSGLKKTFATNIVARRLVQLVNNTRVIHGRNSIQAIVKELATARTHEDGSPISKDATGFLVSGEFSTLVIQDPETDKILIELFDSNYNDSWKNTLKTSGSEQLNNICVTMLGASNKTNLIDALPKTSFTGGLVARILMVMETKRYRLNPLLRRSSADRKYDASLLAPYLRKLSVLRGEFTPEPDAINLYEEWYDKFYKVDVDDPTGARDRMNDHILKIAMLVSLARSPDLVMTRDDLKRGINLCMDLVGNVKRISSGQGKSEFAPKTSVVIEALLEAPDNEMARSDLIDQHYGEFTAYELDVVIETLNQGRNIDIQNLGGEVVYKLKSEIVERYKKIKDAIE